MGVHLKSAKWTAHGAIAATLRSGVERLRTVQSSGAKNDLERADAAFRSWFYDARDLVRAHVHEGSLTVELDGAYDAGAIKGLWDYSLGPDEHTRAQPTRRIVAEMCRRVIFSFAAILRAIEDAPEESEIVRDLERIEGDLPELVLCVQRTLQEVRAEQAEQLKKHGELLRYIHGHSDYVFQLLASEQLKPALRQFIEKFGPRGVDLAVTTAVGGAL